MKNKTTLGKQIESSNPLLVPVTLKYMAEVICEAKILRSKEGQFATEMEILEYSPTGEISKIIDWYNESMWILDRCSEQDLVDYINHINLQYYSKEEIEAYKK